MKFFTVLMLILLLLLLGCENETTNNSDIPEPPELVSPVNGSNNQNSSSGSIRYHLQVSSSSSFGNYIVDKTDITSTTHSFSGLSFSTRFYWRIRANSS